MTHTASFQNRSAAFIWALSAIWLAALAAMSYVFYRDGPPDGIPAIAVLGLMLVFWLGGAGLFAFAASKP